MILAILTWTTKVGRPGTANAAGRTSSSTASATPGRRHNVRNAYGACDWPSPRRRGADLEGRDVRVRCSFHNVFNVFSVFLCFSMSSPVFSQTHCWFSHEMHILPYICRMVDCPFLMGGWCLAAWQELYGAYPSQNAWCQGPFYYEETGMKNMAKLENENV